MGRRTRGSISKRGDRWYVRFLNEHGKRTTRGSWRLKADAESALRGFLAEVDGKRGSAKDIDPDSFLLHHYSRLLDARVASTTKRTMEDQIGAFGQWSDEHDVVFLRDVTRSTVGEWCADMAARWKPSTTSRAVSCLASMWDEAIARGFADENPWRGVKLKRQEDFEIRWREPAEIAAVLAEIRPRDRDLFELLYETGMRIGEALGIRFDDVRGKRLLIARQIEAKKRKVIPPKSRVSRLVPLSVRALEIIDGRRGQADPFVLRPMFSRAHYKRTLDAACEAAGVAHMRVHDLRHVFASHAVHAGTPVPTVAGLLGHRDGGALVLRRYGRWAPRDADLVAMRHLEDWRRAR